MRQGTRARRLAPAILPLAAALVAAGPAIAEVVIHVPADQATLTAAVAAVPNGGTIELAAGTYASPAAGFSLSNLNKGFTVRAASPGNVFLDGGSARPVLRIENSSAANGKPIVFEGITFRNGSSTSAGVAGGVSIKRGEATFVDCVFDNNQRLETSLSELAGGGAGVSLSSRAFFLRTLFNNNRAKNNGGGLSVSSDSDVYLQSSRFVGNRTDVSGHRNTAAGGAVSVVDARLHVANTRFDSNRSGYVAGAIYALGSWVGPVDPPSSEVWIVNSTFESNQAFSNGVATPGPTEAGAVQAEDETAMHVSFSRFLRNSAQTGGGLSLYRALVDVDESIFRGNRADPTGGGGFGGSLNVLSNDTSSGDPDRRSGSLSVSRSFVRGSDPPTVTTVGKAGGCLQATGDQNRRTGGVTPQGSAASTRATLAISDSVFYDCDVTSSSLASGGAFDVYLTSATIQNSLFLSSDALGTSSSGGAGRLTLETVATVTNSTFARNTAVGLGGALYAQGSDVDVSGSRFVWNEFSPGVSEPVTGSIGAAIFSAGQSNWPTSGVQVNQTGTVSSTTFSENIGLPVFDDDRNSAGLWFNDQRYDGNTFYNTTFGNTVYTDSLACCKTASELNALVVVRTQGNTDKSQVANSQPGTAPVVKDLRIVPTRIVGVTAAGDAATSTEAFAGFAWGGGSATLDGVTVTGNAGAQSVSDGSHTLTVAGQDATDFADSGPTPAARLTATPLFVSSGQNVTLDWQTLAGDFLDVAFDQGLSVSDTSSGSVVVAPIATTTYRAFVVTEQGGVPLQVTVFVGEGDGLFADSFETADVSLWSDSSP